MVDFLAFSPGPKQFDLKNGPDNPSLLELDLHTGTVTDTIFDPNSKFILTFGEDLRIVRWDLTVDDPSSNPDVIAQLPSKLSSWTVSPDGHWLFTACDDDSHIRRWDLNTNDPATGETILTGHELSVRDLRISPDGRRLASASLDKKLRLWNLEASAPQMESIGEIQSKTNFRDLLFSPDSRYLAARESNSSDIHIWDTKAGDVAESALVFTGHSSLVTSICFHPEGRTMASGEFSGDILIWDRFAIEPEKTASRLRGHTNIPIMLRFFSNNRRLLSVGIDNTARIWETDPDRLLQMARKQAGRDLTDEERQLYDLKTAVSK